MSIAYDNSTAFHSVANNTNHAFNHTVTGSNPILWWGGLRDSTITPTSIKYNGVDLTFVVENSNTQRSYLYQLTGPSTGLNSLAVVLPSSSYCYGTAASYTGAKQSGQPDASVSTSSTTSPITSTLTVVAANSWAVLIARNGTIGITSAGTGSTQRQADTGYTQFYDSNADLAAGSRSMDITFTGTPTQAGTAMASFAPFVASGASNQFLTMVGCG